MQPKTIKEVANYIPELLKLQTSVREFYAHWLTRPQELQFTIDKDGLYRLRLCRDDASRILTFAALDGETCKSLFHLSFDTIIGFDSTGDANGAVTMLLYTNSIEEPVFKFRLYTRCWINTPIRVPRTGA